MIKAKGRLMYTTPTSEEKGSWYLQHVHNQWEEVENTHQTVFKGQ